MQLRIGLYVSSLLRSFRMNEGPTALTGYVNKNRWIILFLNWTDHTLWLLDVVRAIKGRRAQRSSHSQQFYFRALCGMSGGFVACPFSFQVFLLPSLPISHQSWLWELMSNIEAFILETESGHLWQVSTRIFFLSQHNNDLSCFIFSACDRQNSACPNSKTCACLYLHQPMHVVL